MASLNAAAGAGEYGLSVRILADLHRIFSSFPEIEKVVIYGSRARGDFHSGSDIDLAIQVPGLTPARMAELWSDIEDSPIAFKIDLVHLEELENPELKEAILRDARPFYPAVTQRYTL